MENPEGVLNLLDEFAKLKSKEIPNDLEEYLSYVAASGDPVYQWSLIKNLYRQKLINVITEFYEMCPIVEIPRCPNVDPFNYETMKNSLLKRLDSFSSAPFTIQRISELLTTPRKQYSRVDKFMRAIEKNIWVVSTREPGPRDSSAPQETSANLVNGVTPRVCVTVKHPKRIKSIEDRIKSGHPQLIDDEEEEDEEGDDIEEFEQMEEETSTQILANNVGGESSLQCTSVKDLIEKYENGTIFSNAEEKTNFEEKSNQLEETQTTSVALTTTTESMEPSLTTAKSMPLTESTNSTDVITTTTTITTMTDCTHVTTSPSQPNLDPICENSEEKKEITLTCQQEGEPSPNFLHCQPSQVHPVEPVKFQDSLSDLQMPTDKSDGSVVTSVVDKSLDHSSTADPTLTTSCHISTSESNPLEMIVEPEGESVALETPSVEDSNESHNFSSLSSSDWQEKADSVLDPNKPI